MRPARRWRQPASGLCVLFCVCTCVCRLVGLKAVIAWRSCVCALATKTSRSVHVLGKINLLPWRPPRRWGWGRRSPWGRRCCVVPRRSPRSVSNQRKGHEGDVWGGSRESSRHATHQVELVPVVDALGAAGPTLLGVVEDGRRRVEAAGRVRVVRLREGLVAAVVPAAQRIPLNFGV